MYSKRLLTPQNNSSKISTPSSGDFFSLSILTLWIKYAIILYPNRKIFEVFGDVAGAPPPLPLMPAPNTSRVFFCLLTASKKSCIIFTSFNILNMGMRKKGRDKEKAQWKKDKITRDKKKLKRVRKAAAAKVL
jgi:hypothetical protein